MKLKEVMSLASSNAVLLYGKTYRKQIMKYGTFRHPNPWLSDDPEYDWQFDMAAAQEIKQNFDSHVVDSVRLIGSHNEDGASILGTIIGLEVTVEGIDAIIEVQDQSTIDAIDTIAGDGRSLASSVSVGLDPNFINEDANKDLYVAGMVLRHVALVTIPFIGGMKDWQTVEASAKQSKYAINFGHEDYHGIPLVPESELQVDMKTIRQAIKLMAKAADKTEAEIAKTLNIDLSSTDVEDVAKVKDVDGKELEATLKENLRFFANAMPGGDDDEDEDDDDDDDDEVEDKKAAVSEAEKITAAVASAMKPLNKQLKAMGRGLAEAQEAVNATRERQIKDEANTWVTKELINAGKIAPAEKDVWVNGYLANKEHTLAMSKTLAVRFVYGKENGQAQDPEMSLGSLTEEQVEEKIGYYMSRITPTVAGKQDHLTRKEN